MGVISDGPPLAPESLAQLSQLSVVVPLAPGEMRWQALLEDLAALPPGAEVIVVGAVGEPVPRVARSEWPDGVALQMIAGSRGRARQLNRGACAARGRWLWFLHADSRLAADTLPALARFVAVTGAAIGYFDLRFSNGGPRCMYLNELGARFRSRRLGLPFGDQGLVLPAALFATLGGYDERVSNGEDHLLVWAAHRARNPVLPVGADLWTSADNYAHHGWLATTARHLGLTLVQALPQAWLRLTGR